MELADTQPRHTPQGGPHRIVGWPAFLSVEVAATVAKGIVNLGDTGGQALLIIVFAGLVGGILWNLLTWLLGIPSSSSHALFGGLIGATIAALGMGGVEWSGVVSLVPAVLAPVVACLVAATGTRLIYRITARVEENAKEQGFRWGADRVGLAGLARARHQRRPEDHGHHLPGLGGVRQHHRRHRDAVLGETLVRPRDRPGHLPRRLADHPHAREGFGRDHLAPGDGRRGVLGRNHPHLQPLRPPALDHPGRDRIHPRHRDRQVRGRGPVGCGRPDGGRVAVHPALRRHGRGGVLADRRRDRRAARRPRGVRVAPDRGRRPVPALAPQPDRHLERQRGVGRRADPAVREDQDPHTAVDAALTGVAPWICSWTPWTRSGRSCSSACSSVPACPPSSRSESGSCRRGPRRPRTETASPAHRPLCSPGWHASR
ncbi:inorganic phosphate transporter [Rhodococcus opacus M213]|uniref:Phosphate transporter n=1 Tax=Rhodococcus opacus M213 TaxID=1129896 RepID=K8Y195_RHOOP|nr:inorganic phosphate transporter [Rhodococcus opacus M213]